ncbi:ankyrin [Rhizodiscina lignyota]|uniref:Ankyrin n=1 Tax=Rhizodiscina lignyota TaxID=1504668 RepID=A0A9P4INQ0_9PEZI|nr:ankyrin [Rhizodiscina lignyota]
MSNLPQALPVPLSLSTNTTFQLICRRKRADSKYYPGCKIQRKNMIEVSTRLRRAIVLNDLPLVKRIVRNNPQWLQNPDYDDKSNTSLHLASKEGFAEIAEYLIEAGHEDQGISRNVDWDTPLMIAAAHGRVEVGLLLINRFPRCVPWANQEGMDALMLSAGHGTLPLLTPLLTTNPSCSPNAHDNAGNTALHHASAAGELKALRVLLSHGASPLAQNAHNWTPIAYSASIAAEVYFKNLVAEFEKWRVESMQQAREREREKERQRAAGVRLVTGDEMMQESLRNTPDEWSPIEPKRMMTPTAAKSDAWASSHTGSRARASSGD